MNDFIKLVNGSGNSMLQTWRIKKRTLKTDAEVLAPNLHT